MNTFEKVKMWILTVIVIALVIEVIHLRIDLMGLRNFVVELLKIGNRIYF